MKSWIIVAAGSITTLAFASYAIVLLASSWPIEDWSIAKASLFGDSFGVLNSFFTGGAFLLILWTIVLQQQELQLQRQEMSRMVAAHHRELHMELLNYAFDDPDLAKVWGGNTNDPKVDRQYMYINLIMSQWYSLFDQGLLKRNRLKWMLDKRMEESEYFRNFWARNSRDWRANIEDAALTEFCDLSDFAYLAATSGASKVTV